MKNSSFSTALEQLPQPQRMVLLTIAVFLVTGIIGVTVIYTSWQHQRTQLQRQYQEEQQRADLLSAIRGQEERLTEKEKKLLLPTGGTSVLTGEVSRLASQNGIAIDSITPQSDIAFGPYTRFQIQVLATARFQDLFQFLSALEQERPLLKIDQVEIGAPTQQTQESYRGFNRPEEGNSPPKPDDRQKTKLLISAFSRHGISS